MEQIKMKNMEKRMDACTSRGESQGLVPDYFIRSGYVAQSTVPS
jgi:hypothetical protein